MQQSAKVCETVQICAKVCQTMPNKFAQVGTFQTFYTGLAQIGTLLHIEHTLA